MILRRCSNLPYKMVMPLANHTSMRLTSSSATEDDVIFQTEGTKGLITLNRPKQLNALNLNMIRKIYPKLQEWKNKMSLIVIKGTGEKSFCAGGDVVALAKDKEGAVLFFKEEYKNNALIASLKVPYVALLNGIVMGGGVGVSIHGGYRVATEKTLFAMPETLIGLFPDVGVSYHLARMPSSLGMYLALTGYRLQGFDLHHSGIATHYCASEDLPNLEKALMDPGSAANVETLLNDFHSQAIKKMPNKEPPKFSLAPHIPMIKDCFSLKSADDIFKFLEGNQSKFAEDTLGLLKKMSPTSVKLTHLQIQEAAKMSVYEVLNMDYRLAVRVVGKTEFAEGVRALLVDKDKKPKWSPNNIQAVRDTDIREYFLPLTEDLELNLPSSIQA